MKVLVTGATGFIGRYLVPLLLEAGHQVTVICRDRTRLATFDWSQQLKAIEADLQQLNSQWLELIGPQDALVHLAWQGLPNYQERFHIDQNLPADIAFLTQMIEQGIEQIVVTGTCFEYGNQSGCLAEDAPTMPENNYAIAKNELRKQLQALRETHPFTLQWARLFYMYGEGQSPKSLLSQLQLAIDQQHTVFNMSGGEQLRDYLPVETVAEYLLKLIERPDYDGIVNICSGKPISIKHVVEQYLKDSNASIELNLGYYPYSDQEPMAFWGDDQKIQACLKTHWQ